MAAAYSYFNLGESSSSSDDEDYSPEDWKKVRDVSCVCLFSLRDYKTGGFFCNKLLLIILVLWQINDDGDDMMTTWDN